ncbi:MAG: twin-arginine translocase TatA/TatE family subunit [Planctomycetaceae bacterium]|nr:twin-arginine translocase TatA/TatE family subunit [Planctomycetaceae bacterium]
MFGIPGGMEMIIVLVIVLLLFGNRLPGAMKSLGQSFVSFKKGMREESEDGSEPENGSARS